MGKLVEVKRYFCPCCEKIFITQRHKNCKFNPELKGCFTCRYTVCINEKIVKDEEFGETTEKTIRCDFGTGREISMLELSQAKWRQNCPDWEMIPSYESKSDFYRIFDM